MNEPLQRHQRLTVTVGGGALSAELSRSVSVALVRRALGVPAVAEVDFVGPPGAADGSIQIGADVRIEIGPAELFTGSVAAVEVEHHAARGRTLRLRAYDPLERLRQRSRARRLEDTSVDAIAAELAGECGLAAGASRSGLRIASAIQRGESDLEFLTDLASREGLYPIADAGSLNLVGLDGEGEETELHLGQGLIEVRATRSAERAWSSVSVAGWNPASLEAEPAEATGAAETGAGDRILADRLVDNAAESRALGEAELGRGTASLRVAEGTCSGDPALRPGRPVRLAGIGEEFEGRYVLTSVLHRVDAATGYRVEFSTRPPVVRARSREPIVTLGRVVSIADPSKRGRCKVALPGFPDVEASWLQTMVPGAGKRKGMTALPETGEDVLVVFPEGDLAHGFVLGGLYGTRALPPGLGGTADRPFVIRTGNGQMLELSGKGGTARLSTAGGSLLEFTGSKARLAAASDLVIEAPGKRILIRAAAIDFEKG
ncbi:MAG: phage baseplate assembly protein V [Bauldia sp.]|nr:phage baseplate assembly protein V [Bauldia sp.]